MLTIIGLLLSAFTLWAANGAKQAAIEAKRAVRVEDRRTFLMRRLTELLTDINSLEDETPKLDRRRFERRVSGISRDILSSALASRGHFQEVHRLLAIAVTSMRPDVTENLLENDGTQDYALAERTQMLKTVADALSEARGTLEFVETQA